MTQTCQSSRRTWRQHGSGTDAEIRRGPTTITGHTTLIVDIETYQTKHLSTSAKLSRQRFFSSTRQISTEPMPAYDSHFSISQTIATAKVLNILQPVSNMPSDDQTQHIYQHPNPTRQRHPLFWKRKNTI